MTKPLALIVDDEPDIRELLEITLIRMGIDTQSAETVGQAHAFLAEHSFNLVLTDMNLPDGNGIELVGYIQENYPTTPVAMITAYGSVETAINALKAGAFDFISKPVDLSQLRDIVSSALKLSDSRGGNGQSKHNDNEPEKLLLGRAPAIAMLNKQVGKLARSQAPIYISGESGSGKELVARSIHAQGARASAAFIAVNCGAIPSELMESEFFGHKKGSFSGAHEDKLGLFEAAHGGTLFLDEVADLPLSMQVKLLRAIQEKSIRPVGAQAEQAVDVRILSATHKDLESLVEQGSFRQDLFYRINVIKLDVPSLRERRSDIPFLAAHFLEQISKECDVHDASISSEALEALQDYEFPGNVRELENIIERAFTLCENDTIEIHDLKLRNDLDDERATNGSLTSEKTRSTQISTPSPSPAQDNSAAQTLPERPAEQSLEDYLESIERTEIEAALQSTKWNRTAAAKKLGITFRALRYRLKKLEMD